jgi:F-type H+-transporting ATPase subunit delta
MADTSTIARPYARAVFDIAKAANTLSIWSEALRAAAAVVSDAQAKRYLANPTLTDQQRAGFVEVLSQDIPGGALWRTQEGKNLLLLLAENDRLQALPEISAQFDALKSQAENVVRVTLVSATPVDDSLASQVTQALQQKLGRNVDLQCEVDQSIIGGAIIRADDMVIDGSVRTRLQRLAEALID